MDPIFKIITVTYGFASSLYLFLRAWQILYKKKKVLPLTGRFGLWLCSILYGEEAERKRRAKFLLPDYLRRVGIQAVFGGILMLFITIGVLIAY